MLVNPIVFVKRSKAEPVGNRNHFDEKERGGLCVALEVKDAAARVKRARLACLPKKGFLFCATRAICRGLFLKDTWSSTMWLLESERHL